MTGTASGRRGIEMKKLIIGTIGLLSLSLVIGWSAIPFLWYSDPNFNLIQAIFLVGSIPFGVVVGIAAAMFLDSKGLL